MTALLVLFDVDGTLFETHDPLAVQALREALEECYDLDLPSDVQERVDHRGQTALRIGRLVLAAAGVEEPDGLADWCRRFAQRYLELVAPADTSGWRAGAGAEAALERLAETGLRLALLTGNPEPIARLRMQRLGLARFFPTDQGAFGCESESRAELIGLARARAGGWPADSTVEVGDTERDVSTAREAGIGSLLVGSAGLDAVADELLARSG